MKKMVNSLVMASSILLLGANTYAAQSPYGDFSHYSGKSMLNTTIVDTKNEAYSIGFKTLQELQSKTSRELNDTFRLNLKSLKEKDSVSIEDGSYITVEELMNEQGNIVYKGVVNVNYHYSRERNN